MVVDEIAAAPPMEDDHPPNPSPEPKTPSAATAEKSPLILSARINAALVKEINSTSTPRKPPLFALVPALSKAKQ
jgi:hypothetical protein